MPRCRVDGARLGNGQGLACTMFEGLITVGLVLGVGVIGVAMHYNVGAAMIAWAVLWAAVLWLPESEEW